MDNLKSNMKRRDCRIARKRCDWITVVRGSSYLALRRLENNLLVKLFASLLHTLHLTEDLNICCSIICRHY